jgi:hypothetical protein
MGELVVGFFCVLLIAGMVAAVVFGGWRMPPGGGLVVVLLLATVARADEPIPTSPCGPVPAGFQECSLVTAGYAGSEMLYKAGANKIASAFARTQADLLGPWGSHFVGRADVSVTPDDTATKQSSFQTVEASLGLYRPVSPYVSLMVVGSVAMPLIAGTEAARPHPAMYAGGLMLGSPRAKSFLFVGAGIDQAAGAGLKCIAGGQLRVRGNTYISVRATIGGPQSYVKQGSLLGTVN